MATEAPFVRETSSADTRDKRWSWMMATAEEGAQQGFAYFVVSFDARTMTVRIEGWREKEDAYQEPCEAL